MIRRPPRSTRVRSSAASDVYKRQLMGIFWVTFLGLVLWALSRLFAGPQRDDGVHEDLESPRYHLDLGLWVPTPTGSAASNPQQPQLRPLSSHRPGGGGRTRSRKGA